MYPTVYLTVLLVADEKTSRNKGKQTVPEEKGSAVEEITDAGAKRSTRSTRNKGIVTPELFNHYI